MRKICAVTSTRAEYGIMSGFISKLYNDPDVNLQLIVTGMHLSEKFGMTKNEIEIPVYKEIDIEIEKEPAYSYSLAVQKFSKFFKEAKPDIVVILGDRYEIMAVAVACMFNNIPIAHISGGDTTEGAIDEAIRHSITKMSHLHFTSCEEYRKRVIQLGENPERVFNVGSLAIENIKSTKLLSKDEFEKSIDFKLNKRNLLVTFHPVTLEGSVREQFQELLNALEELANTNIIITCPNSDEGSDVIFEMIKNFEESHDNIKSFTSLGMLRYYSAMKYVDMVVGNSSSGIYETPSFKIPTINIGNRQKGRLQTNSIINCNPKKEDILRSIELGYNKDCSKVFNIYEKDNTSSEIIRILKTYSLNNILKKEFYDL